ncbi:molecular chaperone DnaJ [Patescibacteria group bacterium]|nr:molecular chaperone DnaJ [Patescibacteria group bacterium]MBU1016469.1 molecular chaperone DnaJ [Patescibacteria group bacterium]MBU1684967.1 molecular chaperone DnaJ [Patescibacteria group bacterium]MBU1939005.1 molecular chaperone DnaJ [Patescibacteria group bacterium]
MDYYKILGIEKNASDSEIKKAYRKLAQQYHPDTGKGDEKKFKEVTEAYEVLGDKQKRAQYDQFGSAGPGFGAGDFGGFDFKNVNFDFGGNFGDIFDTFFGGGQRTARKKGPGKGGDIEMVLQISFEEAIFGVSKEIEVSAFTNCEHCKGIGAEPGTQLKSCENCSGTGQQVRLQRTPFGQIQTASTCQNCEGAGRIPEKKCKNCKGEGRLLKTQRIKARIPAGIHDQAVIRLTGKGEAGFQGGSSGDLFLHISVAPNKEFERIKDDIYTTKHIHVLQAILGDEITIKTVHGDTKLIIPAGTESGSSLKLKGYGVPGIGSSSKGDHIVKIRIDIPKKLSGKEKKLYDELVKESMLDIKPQSKGFFS